jgi:succinate dehydrogenase / fumarate reductase iron-sulfur subunit
MADYTLRVRRYDPESGNPAYWQDFQVEFEPSRSVLDGILRAKWDEDGSLSIRCSCQAAICGSCAVRINGKSALACNTKLGEALEKAQKDGNDHILVEPMNNMPVIKDLIVDMDAVHWKKVQRVVPWLLPEGDPPEREYIVPAESMIDITQSMACIHCGACNSACLALEVDPEFVGPAALAKAYRFVGDPRDAHHEDRLLDLAEDPHGIYDCTHCFACVEVCPKDVAPMNQIMRLRRRAGSDFDIEDANNGERHEAAFVSLVHHYGLLNEAELLPRSFGGDSPLAKFKPSVGMEMASSLPSIAKALLRRKVTPAAVLKPHKLPKADLKQIDRIYKEVEGQPQRLELNLYITGYDED